MKSLYIHIGLHKTATSVIQYFLHQNKSRLKERDLYYPDFDGERAQHCLLLKWFDYHKEYCGDLEKKPDELFRELGDFCRSGKGKVVISSEEFSRKGPSSVDPFDIKKLVGDIPVKIVVYLRRQDQFLESCYNQMAKNSAMPCFDDFIGDLDSPHIDHLYLDYHELISKWGKAFGNDNMVIRIFEKEHWVGNSIFEDFFDSIGECYYSYFDKIPIFSANESIDARTILAFDALQIKDRTDLKTSTKIENYWKRKNQNEDIKYTLMPIETRRKILDFFKERNNMINEKFYVHKKYALKDHNLFSEKINTSLVHKKSLSEKEIKDLSSLVKKLRS